MQIEWTNALVGGAIIGVAVSLMLFLHGRVTGISGILNNAIFEKNVPWRWAFLGGLLAGGFLLRILRPGSFEFALRLPTWQILIAGILVGLGTTMGSGCTSGHGVCGISRLSLRSIVATGIFILCGIIGVLIFKNLGLLP